MFLFIQPLFLYFEHDLGVYSVYPYSDEIIFVHTTITVILMVLSIIFCISKIYLRFQEIQYLVVILVSQNVGLTSSFIISILLLGEEVSDVSPVPTHFLLSYTIITLSIGLALFCITFLRFYILIHKGQYRKGSSKDRLRSKLETKSYLPMAIMYSIGFVFVLQYLFRNTGFVQYESIFILVMLLLIFYSMIFVLPEQLVILYCKYRFKSFNFESNGKYLLPLAEDEDNQY
ncbi:hypothetical protein JCM9152_3589 [Halalkalibacter hemicellulosilyticusJCM 9152]|uniref:Uncharacterized protein n=1 Tax=Halalkalibacter hemicellulosilyticusJCM 9152 TaxID=1236971 RepID=W4QKA9_9BACI|nr:hypothetical protein JCM9152_3589 [Halalkalibacter hemicellulosilyticusJCM 9152]